MLEARGDLWELGSSADAIVITTNGFVKKDGTAVMGAGCAKEAAEKYPWLPAALGALLKERGNYTYRFQTTYYDLVTMPVKHNWREDADMTLIQRSVNDLIWLANEQSWERIVMPRPGCGNGNLRWEDVEPVLADYLDDRFTVVTYA